MGKNEFDRKNTIFSDEYDLSQTNKILIANATLSLIPKDKPSPFSQIKVEFRRRLTEREIIMCRSVFKDSIDYTDVWIIMGGLLQSITGNAITPFGHITLPRSDYINYKDFSKAPPNVKHWFMHEVTHVWQHQMGFSNLKAGKKLACNFGYSKTVDSPDSPNGEDLLAYKTDLSGRNIYKRFSEFNMEQQGRIIELYFDGKFLKFNNPERKHHKLSIKLERHVMFALEFFLKDPKDKSQLPRM
jgi:hypothetical protein